MSRVRIPSPAPGPPSPNPRLPDAHPLHRMEPMRKLLVLFTAFAALLPAQYKSGAAAQPSSDVPAALASQLGPGTQITDASGKPYAEIWLRKTAPSGPKSTEDAVTLPTIPVGSFLGVIRFDGNGSDRRGQQIKPGIYTLRYALMPNTGDHLVASP